MDPFCIGGQARETPGVADLRRAQSHDLDADELRELRRLLDDAFAADPDGAFADTDWDNSLGGTHVLLEVGDLVLAHASVVPRRLRIGERDVSAGYVEAVATRPEHQRQGHATRVLEEVARVIAERYEIGALSTGVPTMYERVGWELWRGPTSVATPDGILRTADDDGGIMVLRTSATWPLDLGEPITCDWRPGDVW
jgi:aminoglycoside 2'-N-acetyltransferase I